MGHHRSDHRTGDQRFQKGVQSPLLGGPTAQQRHRGALFVGPDVRDHKAGRLSHSGQEGNVPVRTADPGGEDLPAGNTPGNGTQSQVKGAVHVAPLDRRFQNGAGRLGGLKGGEGPFGGRAKPLRQIQFIFRHR